MQASVQARRITELCMQEGISADHPAQTRVLNISKGRFASHQEPPPTAMVSQRWQRETSQWHQTAPRAPLGASLRGPWTCAYLIGLKAPCLYPPLCFTPTDSAGKGNKCFFTIPSNIKLGVQSCDWVQKAIKQSHGIKIHRDCSMLRCRYHHLIPGSPYYKDCQTVRCQTREASQHGNHIAFLLLVHLCLVTILVSSHWRIDLKDFHIIRQGAGLKDFWSNPVNSYPVCLMLFLCNKKHKFQSFHFWWGVVY